MGERAGRSAAGGTWLLGDRGRPLDLPRRDPPAFERVLCDGGTAWTLVALETMTIGRGPKASAQESSGRRAGLTRALWGRCRSHGSAGQSGHMRHTASPRFLPAGRKTRECFPSQFVATRLRTLPSSPTPHAMSRAPRRRVDCACIVLRLHPLAGPMCVSPPAGTHVCTPKLSASHS